MVRGVSLFKNCRSINNSGSQFKVWGEQVWIINSIAYGGNANGGIGIKPLWTPTNVYLLNNTMVNNYWGIRISHFNGSPQYTLKDPNIYMYNNINVQSRAQNIRMDSGCNTNWKEGNKNIYINTGGYGGYDGPSFDYSIPQMSNGTWYSLTGIDQSCQSGTSVSPLYFRNYGSGDYSLSSTSSIAYNTGSSNVGITYDLDGKIRPMGGSVDVGAYEYQTGGQTGGIATPPRNLRIVNSN